MGKSALVLVLTLAAAGLAGCGFTPLYAEQGVTGGLAHIAVEAPDGRTAYLLREELDDVLGHARADTPAYRLVFDLVESRVPRGLGPDNAASRYELSVQVDWKLLAAAGQELETGRTMVLVTYGAADAPYAGIAAQQDGQERAAAEAARRIRLDLAQYFARQG